MKLTESDFPLSVYKSYENFYAITKDGSRRININKNTLTTKEVTIRALPVGQSPLCELTYNGAIRIRSMKEAEGSSTDLLALAISSIGNLKTLSIDTTNGQSPVSAHAAHIKILLALSSITQ